MATSSRVSLNIESGGPTPPRFDVAILAAVYALFAIITVATYWRLAPGATYNFEDTGASGGFSRLIVYLNFPVGIAATAVAALILVGLAGRWRPIVATGLFLSAMGAVPGVVSQSDLTAHWRNVPAVIGVALVAAAAMGVWRDGLLRTMRPITPADRFRYVLIVLLTLWAIPWMFASLGLYASDAPILSHVVLAHQPTPGEPALPSVHLGLHEGLFGVQLGVTALLLSRILRNLAASRARAAVSIYLGVVLAYGFMVAAEDGWNEQLVKRGVTSINLPNVLTPSLSLAWLGVLVAGIAIHRLWFARESGMQPAA